MTSSERAHSLQANRSRCVFGYVENQVLLPHEDIQPARLAEVRESLRRDGILYRPVVVDRESMVILDGHHRVRALEEIECKLIPAYLVLYTDPSIRVCSRRPDITVNKSTVIGRGVSGQPFPARTSRHMFADPLHPRPTRIGLLRHR